MDYFYNSFAHKIFLLCFFLFWKYIVQRLLKLKNNAFTWRNLIIAGLLGLPFDLAGVIMFKLWWYESTNFIQYLDVILSTWILSAPIMLAVFMDVKALLSRIKFKAIKIEISPRLYALLTFLSGAIVLLVALQRTFEGDIPTTPSFYIVMMIFLILCQESLLGLLGVKNFIDDMLEGKYLNILTIFIAGMFVGLTWELFNSQFRIWTYYNIPPGDILGIEIYVVVFYGIINYTYYNFTSAASKLLTGSEIQSLKN